MGTRVSARPGRVLLIVVGALVAIAAAAAFVASLRPAPTWDASTPQGTVQAYLSAVMDGDAAKAATYLDPGGDCDASDLDQVSVNVERVDLVSTSIDRDTARVQVAVAISTGLPLGGTVTENHTFRLTRAPGSAGSPGRWLMVGTPWPLYTCGGVK